MFIRQMTYLLANDPTHSQSIGLVTRDRDPQSPLAYALVKCAAGLDLESMLSGLAPQLVR